MIPTTADQIFAFVGEGFSGFAWSTVNPQLVVAAVSQAYEGTLVNAERTSVSAAGLYYSTDSGATWAMARISDGASGDVQGPLDMFKLPPWECSDIGGMERAGGGAASRRFGFTGTTNRRMALPGTRMTTQPGTRLTTQKCPTNPGSIGSVACPMFRGTLAVNPLTGDTFAWTVDLNDQDQGLWQDQCSISGSACSNQTVVFQKQWSTTALESDTAQGAVTVANGDYNLALAAVPSGQDTVLLAGANDLWKCSLAAGCVWRNTTNANTCLSAEVGGYQHALAWNTANPLEVFVGKRIADCGVR